MDGPLGVVTRGLLPPMAPGRMEPVSLYLARILLTQPCDTRSCLEMSQGRMPSCRGAIQCEIVVPYLRLRT